MTKQIDNGGLVSPTYDDGSITALGMTMLDYFAGQALTGCLAVDANWEPEILARYTYQYAMAMVAEKRRCEGGNNE